MEKKKKKESNDFSSDPTVTLPDYAFILLTMC